MMRLLIGIILQGLLMFQVQILSVVFGKGIVMGGLPHL